MIWCAVVSAALLVFALHSGVRAEGTPKVPDGRAKLVRPDPQFTQVPFWFWNDELNDEEIKRQLAAFREHGVYGFVIHARMGLPAHIPYMGERWLRHVRTAVDEAARTGMRVCLYDEGMYPSGSAHGEVVRSNPTFAAQALAETHKDLNGPAEIDVPGVEEGRHVATVAVRRIGDGDALDLTDARRIDRASGKVALPEGKWRIMTFACVPSRGHIRGVHPGEDDGQPGAPPAADLLNPEAMKAFIRFSYDPYYKVLKDHFGRTVIAMFTDEPSLLGRGARRNVQPWTDGLAEFFAARRGYRLEPLLPALFFEAGPRTHRIRDEFHLTVAERLDETYYQPLSAWCAQRGIALTGHPAESDEIRPLRFFQIPGQDMVWRWVLPESPSALEGAHSTVGKCSSSVARHDGRRRNANEIYGAYGWQLTMDEMKWLADWLMVRGVNLLYPHAFYYSLQGDRAHERPPDLGMHNAWWPYYRLFADYTSRLCGLLTDCRQVCEVAVLSVNNRLPWRAAKWLFQNQVDFNYLEDWRLCDQAKMTDGRLVIGEMAYRMLIVDQDEAPVGPVGEGIKAFEAAGGLVRYARGTATAEWVAGLDRDVVADPPSNDLRYVHVAKDGADFYLFTNEGSGPIDTTVSCRCVGRAEWFDAWTGRFHPAGVIRRDAATMCLPLRLGRRESIVLCVWPGEPPVPSDRTEKPPVPTKKQAITGPWQVADVQGRVVGNTLGNWLDSPGMEKFAGMLIYRTAFRIDGAIEAPCTLDLGGVGDWAVVRLNGHDLGPRFWAPFVWDVSTVVRTGQNELAVEVTNSLANRYDPKQRRPSGLFGPVVIAHR